MVLQYKSKIKKRDLIKKILVDGDLVTIEKILDMTGRSEDDIKKWKAAKEIIYVDVYGKELFASYCIDKKSGVPINGVKEIIDKLPFQKTNLAVAAWFSSENTFLKGDKPKDLIKSDISVIFMAIETEFSKEINKKTVRNNLK